MDRQLVVGWRFQLMTTERPFWWSFPKLKTCVCVCCVLLLLVMTKCIFLSVYLSNFTFAERTQFYMTAITHLSSLGRSLVIISLFLFHLELSSLNNFS